MAADSGRNITNPHIINGRDRFPA